MNKKIFIHEVIDYFTEQNNPRILELGLNSKLCFFLQISEYVFMSYPIQEAVLFALHIGCIWLIQIYSFNSKFISLIVYFIFEYFLFIFIILIPHLWKYSNPSFSFLMHNKDFHIWRNAISQKKAQNWSIVSLILKAFFSWSSEQICHNSNNLLSICLGFENSN